MVGLPITQFEMVNDGFLNTGRASRRCRRKSERPGGRGRNSGTSSMRICRLCVNVRFCASLPTTAEAAATNGSVWLKTSSFVRLAAAVALSAMACQPKMWRPATSNEGCQIEAGVPMVG